MCDQLLWRTITRLDMKRSHMRTHLALQRTAAGHRSCNHWASALSRHSLGEGGWRVHETAEHPEVWGVGLPSVFS